MSEYRCVDFDSLKHSISRNLGVSFFLSLSLVVVQLLPCAGERSAHAVVEKGPKPESRLGAVCSTPPAHDSRRIAQGCSFFSVNLYGVRLLISSIFPPSLSLKSLFLSLNVWSGICFFLYWCFVRYSRAFGFDVWMFGYLQGIYIYNCICVNLLRKSDWVMAAPPARARADYDFLIKLLLIGDSGTVFRPRAFRFFFFSFDFPKKQAKRDFVSNHISQRVIELQHARLCKKHVILAWIAVFRFLDREMDEFLLFLSEICRF